MRSRSRASSMRAAACLPLSGRSPNGSGLLAPADLLAHDDAALVAHGGCTVRHPEIMSGLGRFRMRIRNGLEPISKSSEEDNEAGELDKAEEVLSVVLPADEDATLPLYPGEEALDEPAPHVTA